MVVLEEYESESSQEPTAKRMAKAEAVAAQSVAPSSGSGVDGESGDDRGAHALSYFDRNEIEVGKVVGEGYHGIVYEIARFRLRDDNIHSAEQLATRQKCFHHPADNPPTRYVMKHLHPRLLQAGAKDIQNAALDLVAEANFLQQLDHPNILPIRGLARGGALAFRGGSYDSFFLITERLSETLAQRISRWKRQSGSCSTAALVQRCDYALQIARALVHIHSQQLIFRDLKPGNIGFSAEDPDRIQVFDFGLCRRLPCDSHSEEVYSMSGGVGTRRYCAVEVCQHRPYNAKADVYSWSMVFLQMLTLDKPFAEFSKEDHQKFVCEMGGTPNLSRYNLPDRIQALLRNAWSRNVSKRWSMEQVCEELEGIIAELKEGTLCKVERRRTKAMDRKDVMVNLEEECSSSLGFLSARA